MELNDIIRKEPHLRQDLSHRPRHRTSVSTIVDETGSFTETSPRTSLESVFFQSRSLADAAGNFVR